MDPKILTTHPISLCLWQWEKDVKNSADAEREKKLTERGRAVKKPQ